MDTNKLKILNFRTSVCQKELVNRFNKNHNFSRFNSYKKTQPEITRAETIVTPVTSTTLSNMNKNSILKIDDSSSLKKPTRKRSKSLALKTTRLAIKRPLDDDADAPINISGSYKFVKNDCGNKTKRNRIADDEEDDSTTASSSGGSSSDDNSSSCNSENDDFIDDYTNDEEDDNDDEEEDGNSNDDTEKEEYSMENDRDGSNDRVYDLYERHFQRAKKNMYQKFDAIGDSDMPYFVSIFNGFDAVNDTVCTNFDIKKLNRNVTLFEYYTICNYLDAPEFTIDLLKTTKYDHVVNAIISYILFWSNDDIDDFIKNNPKFTNFFNALRMVRELDGGQYVFDYKGLPFIKQAFKVLRRHFEPEKVTRSPFDWLGIMDHGFISHLDRVYNLIYENKFDFETIKMLEADMAIPYKLPNIDIEKLLHASSNNENQFKFITGQACCCKTTILNKLLELGWRKFSRGDVGSFSGKSSSAAAIGNLHAALDFTLTRPNVIGDRGYIDNVIWSFIMPACSPIDSKSFVYNMLSFLNSNFNEPSIAQYISQKGLIFIDPYVDLNRTRQLNRCESGDSHRARIFMYPIAQFMVYYTVARLFGWKILCVPYDVDRNFDNVKYEQNIDLIRNYFGTPKFDDIIEKQLIRFAKPYNNYTVDTLYPKIVGIFK